MNKHPESAYYAQIPYTVMNDDNLCPNAKLLYGRISALCRQKGHCWASNSYFSEMLKVSCDSISKWIKQLKDASYIIVQINQHEKCKRMIWIHDCPYEKHQEKMKNSSYKNIREVNSSYKNIGGSPIKKYRRSTDIHYTTNNINNNITVEGSKNRSTNCENNKNKLTQENKKYLFLASQLKTIVQKISKKKIHTSDINKWSKSFRLLMTQDKVDSKTIRKTLQWYSNNCQNKYCPVIRSGQAFRKKFEQLQDAIERSKNNTTNNFKQKQSTNKSIKQPEPGIPTNNDYDGEEEKPWSDYVQYSRAYKIAYNYLKDTSDIPVDGIKLSEIFHNLHDWYLKQKHFLIDNNIETYNKRIVFLSMIKRYVEMAEHFGWDSWVSNNRENIFNRDFKVFDEKFLPWLYDDQGYDFEKGRLINK